MTELNELKRSKNRLSEMWSRALLHLRMCLLRKDGNTADEKPIKTELTNGVKKMIEERANMDQIVSWLKEFLLENASKLDSTKNLHVLNGNIAWIDCESCVIGDTSF